MIHANFTFLARWAHLAKMESAKKLLAAGTSPKIVAKDIGVSLATLYRWIPATGDKIP